MKKMIWAAAGLLTLGTAAAFSLPAPAQASPTAFAARHAGKHNGKRLDKLAQSLGLTNDQKAKLSPVLKSAAEQVRGIRQNTSLSPEEKRAQIKEIRKNTRPQILAVLTPAQREKLKGLRHQHHGAKK